MSSADEPRTVPEAGELIEAVRGGDDDDVQELLDQGAPVDERDEVRLTL